MIPDQNMEPETALAAALAELKAAKDKIAQLEALSDLAERLVDSGSFQMDWDTMQVRWSDNNLRIFGISKEEFAQNYVGVTEFIHPDDRASFDATMARVIATREPYTHRHRIVRPNGDVRYVREAAATLGGPDGNLFIGMTQDVTDLVEAKATEAELQVMIRLAGEIAKVGGWKVNLQNQTVEITPVTAALLDAPHLRNLHLSEAFAYYVDESSARLQAAVARSVETGDGFDETLTLVSQLAHERVVRVIGVTERDQESGRISGLRGAVKDVTDITETGEAARKAEEFARMAGHAARLGGWHFDVARQEVTWSAETAALHDEPPGTAPSLDDGINYYIPEHRARIRSLFGDCVGNGVPFNEVLQIVTAKGRKLWVRTIGEPLRNEAGQIVAVQGAFQDITDLIDARDQAAELSEQLRTTMENMSSAFYLLDADWRFIFVNPMAEKTLNRSRDDLLGRKAWEVFPEAPRSVGAKFEIALAEGRLVRFEEYYPSIKTWFEISADPTPQGLAVYFRDITEERAKDEQLRLLEASVSRLNDILLITEAEPLDGPDGPKIVYVNDAFERRTGYSRAEAIGQTPRILQGPKTQRHELDRISQALKEWKPVRSELINYTKSGDEFWLELDIVPLADANGWFTHWVAVERDITDRKKSEQALQVNEERFRLVAKASGSVIWECDLSDESRWYSDGIQEIFGYSLVSDQSGSDVRDLSIHPDDAARVAGAFSRLKAGIVSSLVEQYRFRRADGSWATVEERAFTVMDVEGQAVRILSSMTDISEQLQLENRLRQSQKMEAVGQLTGGIAHDFNNLLTIMMGNVEALSEDLTDRPDLQSMANMALDAADRGAEMTSRLLAFSRKQALEPRVLDLAQVVQGIDGLLRRTLPESIDIEVIRGGGLWKVELDPGQLEAALLNLALNARDAMHDGGSLTIEIANCSLDDAYVSQELDIKAGQYVMLAVTDSGHGISKDVIDLIFEPFFTTKEVGKGSGLGLSMIYGFVKQSGGHIRVYSEPGEGTVFKLYFPRAIGKEEQAILSPSSKNIVGGHEMILVVEDDSMVRSTVVAQLQSLGYHITEATTGKEAVEILQKGSEIDLLFTDVVMPGGMSGRAVADAARAIKPGIRVLFTSGYTENSIVHDGKLDFGVQLLSKPYRREDIALKVRKVLDET